MGFILVWCGNVILENVSKLCASLLPMAWKNTELIHSYVTLSHCFPILTLPTFPLYFFQHFIVLPLFSLPLSTFQLYFTHLSRNFPVLFLTVSTFSSASVSIWAGINSTVFCFVCLCYCGVLKSTHPCECCFKGSNNCFYLILRKKTANLP